MVVYTKHSVPPGCSDTRESEWHVSPTWYWQTSSSFFAAPLKLLSSKNDWHGASVRESFTL